MTDVSEYTVVTADDGTPVITDKKIVVRHITDDDIAFIEDSEENRNSFGITTVIGKESVKSESLEFIFEDDTHNIEHNMVEWHEDNIKALLNLYLEYAKEFRNPRCKKKLIWQKIAGRLGISIDACDRKFRNLKQHYLYILKQKKITSRGRVVSTWPYFQLLDTIFCDDPTIYPDKDTGIVIKTIPTRAPTPLVEYAQSRKRFIRQNEVKNRKRTNKADQFQTIVEDMDSKQVEICSKLDDLIDNVKESNAIQRRRNELFEKYIENMVKK